jgi:CHASE2 domain-containing sensor protein
MAEVVLLNLGYGNLHQGFPLVTVQLRSPDSAQALQFTGSLSPAPNLVSLYQRWQLLYDLLYQVRSIGFRQLSEPTEADDILIEEADVTHVSDSEFFQVCAELQRQIDRWLDTEGFRPLERQLRMRLNPEQSIRVILQTEDSQVRRLPWYTWQFFRDYASAEVALSPLNFAPQSLRVPNSNRMRILVILGDASGIDVQADRKLLEVATDAHICLLAEPDRAEFDHSLWDQEGWDILFFAGHSMTQAGDDICHILLNSTDRLTIPQLRNALVRAIQRGLHLAIFNSCDGLGLASQLADLNIPEIIVMREPIPDHVAQTFLKHFLSAFAAGQSLYLSVREARERLQGLETQYPGASWLPVMFQNPAVEPLMWRSPNHSVSTSRTSASAMGGAGDTDALTSQRSPISEDSSLHSPGRRSRWTALMPVIKNSLLVTILVMGGRWLGVWQPLELWALDGLMGLRPAESMDNRLLIVTLDGRDKAYQTQSGMALQGSLSDQALVKALEILQPHQPAVIGLDIYRDDAPGQGDDPAVRDQAIQLRDKNFIDICFVGSEQNADEIPPPPNVAIENVGFSDLTRDPDLVVRRQLIGMTPGDRCATPLSFSTLVAQRYLQNLGYELQRPSHDYIHIGPARFQKIKAHSGGYHHVDPGGFQVLVNYRATPVIAPAISLQALLEGSLAHDLPSLVTGKIVLIGNIDPEDKDFHLTPYSNSPNRRTEVPGVVIHAHMVSHLISAVLDDRPTLWWWPQWGDTLWVWGWSLGGFTLFHDWRGHRRFLFLRAGSLVVLISGSSFLVLWLLGGWLPLVPTLIANFIIFGVSLHTASTLKPTDR